MYSLKHKKRAGLIRVDQFTKKKLFDFTDYLRGGLRISTITCIDFTGSNGDPSHPSSLHYINPTQPNQYQQAITSVCSILLNYDFDKNVPVYGFGAKVRFPNFPQEESHFFPCSGDWKNCAGNGVSGIFDLYNHALVNLTLWGPTNFYPMIKEVCSFTRASSKLNLVGQIQNGNI
jgi:Copine